MDTTALSAAQSVKDQATKSQNRFLAGLRDLLEIVRDYGFPTVAFGTGIYAFILVLHVPMATELKVGAALALTLLGLLAQLWTYARENPRAQSEEVKDQLRRMTDLVERLVEMKFKDR